MALSKNEYQVLLIALGNQIFRDDKTALEIEADESGIYSEEDKNNVDRSIRRQISLFDKIARKISAPTYELWQESNIQSLQMC